jgi:hypothetical protein
MPNQLSKSKKRQSLAEHEAVLVALTDIARNERTTVMALLRQAARDLVKKRVKEPAQSERLRALILKRAPAMPMRFKTAAQVSRFKRSQREFDQVLLDLELATPQVIQQRNSLVSARKTIRLIDFDKAHAATV